MAKGTENQIKVCVNGEICMGKVISSRATHAETSTSFAPEHVRHGAAREIPLTRDSSFTSY